MGKKKETDKSENKLPQILLLLCSLTLFSFWMLSHLYARYTTQMTGQDSARVAAFHVKDGNDLQETYVLDPSITDGDAQKITVTVENNSEVAVRYTFSFEADGNLPLEITAGAPEGITLQKEMAQNVWTVEKEAAVKWDETYTFTLSMEKEEENYRYSGGVESIRLTVKAEQID